MFPTFGYRGKMPRNEAFFLQTVDSKQHGEYPDDLSRARRPFVMHGPGSKDYEDSQQPQISQDPR